MTFNRKILPDTNYTPNYVTKKRLHEDEINFGLLQIPLIKMHENYPNTYDDGLEFFTAPEGKLIPSKQIPCAKIVDDLSDLFDEDEMSNGIIIN